MLHIDSYSFGKMTVSGTTYTKDLIIFPGGNILYPWWRKQGHVLAGSDLMDLIETQPDIIVVGTGASGLMNPDSEFDRILADRGIDFLALPTAEAAERFNTLVKQRKTGACFHLTC